MILEHASRCILILEDDDDLAVFCKLFFHKVADHFCRWLQLHFVGNCNSLAGCAESQQTIADLFSF